MSVTGLTLTGRPAMIAYTMTRYYPLLMLLRDRLCVVVGGGEVAARKVAALLDCEARVRAIAPAFGPQLVERGKQGRVQLVQRPYRIGDLEGATLAFAATDDPGTNAAVWREATDRGLPINVADDPQHCTFTVPATVRRGPLLLTVSTDGASPALARAVRQRLEQDFGPEYGILAVWLGEFRADIKARYPAQKEREHMWQALLATDILELLRAGQEVAARDKLLRLLDQPTPGVNNVPPHEEGMA